MSPSRKRKLGELLGKMFDRLVTYENELKDTGEEGTNLHEHVANARVALGMAYLDAEAA